MKNLIVAIALVLSAGVSTAWANEHAEDPRAEMKFNREFVGAQNVKWTRLDDGYLRVTFVLNGIGAETYFDQDAEIIGTVRNLFYSQLPLAVVKSIGNTFGELTVIEVKEIINAEGTSYRVVFEKKDRKYNIRVGSLGDIMDVQKHRLKK